MAGGVMLADHTGAELSAAPYWSPGWLDCRHTSNIVFSNGAASGGRTTGASMTRAVRH
ncbi:hypothetical protein CHLRE_16g691204v5 [Chlamydomonas reinhardtii]|uniref:Uncharacterized protein n=1 Tax=Chlamydomonas reinhardtii TaxID=3055 RepID=A0A2K3CSL9_CHLRE|nr:uncharacterized protein CHLRE_16g691204v5 [Chlamydomonas reinhardtii]PNW71262.1 hypothetical protein CHLRE_16g691204v5 [Chlamydomonas reinhardtii]